MLLIHYHLMEDDSRVDEIRIGLEKKLDAMVLRELYGKAKIAPTETEREKAWQEYLDRRGGYLRASAGKVSFNDIRQERGMLL